MAKLICEVCGKEFIAYGQQAKIRRRCSATCYAIHLKRKTVDEKAAGHYRFPIFNCETCGKPILKPNSNSGRETHRFCSHKCYSKFRSKEYRGDKHPQWRGGISYHRGPNWKHLRDEVRRRANYTCQHCGRHESETQEHLHAHHSIPFNCFTSLNHANKLSNLVALCRSCHSKADRKLKDLPRFIPLPLAYENPHQN